MSFSRTPHSRELATTINDFLKGEEVNVLRKRIFWGMLESRGNVTYNHSGTNLEWVVRYDQAAIKGSTGENPLTFSRKSRHKRANLSWRGYYTDDVIHKIEKLTNRGNEALVNVASSMVSNLMEDMTEGMGPEAYVDGEAAGNEMRFHGLETMFGQSANSFNTESTGFTTRTANVADPVIAPDDNYAGLDTDIAAYGGAYKSAAGTWPSGDCDAKADFWTPLIINYNSSAFGNVAGNTWASNCVEALRFGITHCKRNVGTSRGIDVALMDRDMFRTFKTAHDSLQRVIVQNNKEGSAVSLGFQDAINFEGVELLDEYGIPQDVVYGLNFDLIEFMSLQGQLFNYEGPFYDEDIQADKHLIDILGNFKFKSPRNFFKGVSGVSS